MRVIILAMGLVLSLAMPAGAAVYTGALGVDGRPSRARLQGRVDYGFGFARVDTAFRCRGSGCVFKRGFFELFCLGGGTAFGTIGDRRTRAFCEFDGVCPGSTFSGTFLCDDGRRGFVTLRFQRNR